MKRWIEVSTSEERRGVKKHMCSLLNSPISTIKRKQWPRPIIDVAMRGVDYDVILSNLCETKIRHNTYSLAMGTIWFSTYALIKLGHLHNTIIFLMNPLSPHEYLHLYMKKWSNPHCVQVQKQVMGTCVCYTFFYLVEIYTTQCESLFRCLLLRSLWLSKAYAQVSRQSCRCAS